MKSCRCMYVFFLKLVCQNKNERNRHKYGFIYDLKKVIAY